MGRRKVTRDMPVEGEFVIATIRKVMPFGAFCNLDEYDGREAFIHISEVASRWVKNIHEFVKEGQKVVARVHRVIPRKNQIDLSLRRVTEADRRAKMEQYKHEKRAVKLFELCAMRLKKDFKSSYQTIGATLIDKYGDLYSALEQISFNGEKAFKGLRIPKDWKKALIEVAQENIKKSQVFITSVFTITSLDSDGIERIKDALMDAEKAGGDGVEISLIYLGAPYYKMIIRAEDYKRAEKTLQKAHERIVRKMKGHGKVEMKREEG